MKLTHALVALVLGLSLTACDGDDGGTTDEAADADTTTESDTAEDVTCDVFCEAFITQCLQAGKSTEFETNDLCLAACGTWDQAGVNCRNQQIGADACDQAGNMGTACN